MVLFYNSIFEILTYHEIHPFKMYKSVFFLHVPRVVQSLPVSNSRTFLLALKETPHPLVVTPHSHPFPGPWQQLIYFLSLWVPLFWKFHINGAITHELSKWQRKAILYLYSNYRDLIGWISAFRKVLSE